MRSRVTVTCDWYRVVNVFLGTEQVGTQNVYVITRLDAKQDKKA